MRKIILITSLVVMPAPALAGGYIIPNENARDLALSSAATADQDGPEALFLNSAALAGPEGLAVSVSGEILVNRTSWSAPGAGDASIVPQYNTPPSGAISFGRHLNQDMAVGVGIGADVPAGGSLIWPNGWQGQEYVQTVDQKIYRFAAGVGFQLMPQLKIGASFVRYQATEELTQALNFLDHYGTAKLGMSGGSSSFGLGLEARVPQVPLTLGANFSYSGDVALSGDAHFTGVPASFTPLIHDQSVTEALKVPMTLDVGAAYAVAPNVKVMAAYTWEQWSVYKEDKFVGSDGFSVTVPRNYRDASVYRLAAEGHLKSLPRLTLRGGALRSISAQPKNTLSPSLSDGKSWALSIGAGANVLPALRIDFGYQHAWFDDVTATGTETFPGTYRTHVDLFSLGLNWRTDLGLAGH